MKFLYRNHRNEIAERNVIPLQLEFIADPGYGYDAGWFLTCHDLDKNAPRSFSIDRIIPRGRDVLYAFPGADAFPELTTKGNDGEVER